MKKSMKLQNNDITLAFLSDSKGELRLDSLLDGMGKELLIRPTPFVAINEFPVNVTDMRNNVIYFEKDGVSGEMKVSLPQGERHCEINIRLKSEVIKKVCFDAPIISFPIHEKTRYFNPRAGGSLKNRPSSFKVVYSGEASICSTFAYNPGENGIGFGYFNGEQKRIVLENGPRPEGGRMDARFEVLQMKAGEWVELPTFYLVVGTDWREFLEPYKKWLSKSFSMRRDTPPWIFREPWHFYVLRMSFFRGEKGINLIPEIEEGFRYCKQISAQPVFWLGHWWKTCDRIKGNWYFDHFQGDFFEILPETESALRYIKNRNGKVIVYLNITAIGEYSDLYNHADALLIQNENGGYVRNAEYPMMMLCPSCKAVEDYWHRVVEYLFGKLQIDGVFLDQAGGGDKAPYCYHPAHNHHDPDSYGMGLLKLLESVRRKIKSINPDAMIFGELAHDTRTQMVDFWLWHWNWCKLDEADGYGEALVWMKYLRPDAVFLEQNAAKASPESKARKYISRGVWLNTMPLLNDRITPELLPRTTNGGDTRVQNLQYHDICWRSYQKDMELFHSGTLPLQTDREEISAVLYTGKGKRKLVGLMQHQDQVKEVTVFLPYGEDTRLCIYNWFNGEDEKITHRYIPGEGIRFLLREGADIFVIEEM